MIFKLTVCMTILWCGCVGISAQTESDTTLVTELRKLYSNDDGDIRYFLKWFDLNGDDTPEAIVHVAGPQVCGTGGCDTHIFARDGNGYKLISTIGLSRPRIIASPVRSRGWRNLIVFVAGGGVLSGHYAELRFNGKTYPDNPTVKPAKRISGKPRGTVLIEDFKFYTEGKLLTR
jgi:hypothetical protein